MIALAKANDIREAHQPDIYDFEDTLLYVCA